VALYRRPADATFVFGALLAMIAGYLVHRWLTGTIAPARRWQRLLEIAIATALVALAVGLPLRVGELASAALPILWGLGFAAGAVAALLLTRLLNARSAVAAAAVLATFSTYDLAFNNAPTINRPVTALYAALDRQQGRDRLAAEGKAQGGRCARRDRIELIGVALAEYRADRLRPSFGHNPPCRLRRATAAPDTVAGPDQRQFTRSCPLSLDFGGPVRRALHRHRRAGREIDHRLSPAISTSSPAPGTPMSTRTRAPPRVLLATDWRKATSTR
jgi:hypothetical protein